MDYVNVHLFTTEGKDVGQESVLVSNVPNISLLKDGVKAKFPQLDGVEAPALSVYVGKAMPDGAENPLDSFTMLPLAEVNDFAIVYSSTTEPHNRKRKRTEESPGEGRQASSQSSQLASSVVKEKKHVTFGETTIVPIPTRGKKNRIRESFALLKQEKKSFPKPPDQPREHLLEREEAKKEVLAHIGNCMANKDKDRGKFTAIGIAGINGIGKTQFLTQLCENWIPTEVPNCKCIYVTYKTEDGKAGPFCMNVTQIAEDRSLSLSRLLLVTMGLSAGDASEISRYESWDLAMSLARARAGCADSDTLVIAVDELRAIDECNPSEEEDQSNRPWYWQKPKTLAETMLSELMGKQDQAQGKLVFVFSAIEERFLTSLNGPGSGRVVHSVCLDPLSMPVFLSEEVLGKDLLNKCMEVPLVHQLVLSCCGHPRAIFDGLPDVQRKLLLSLRKNDNHAVELVVNARRAILEVCNFQKVIVEKQQWLSAMLEKWFSLMDWHHKEEQQCILDGALLRIHASVVRRIDFFFPLLMQYWADNNVETTMGYHLSQCYALDLVDHKGGFEETMEGIMYHHEAILRKAMEGKSFSLKDFYRSQHVGREFIEQLVTAPVGPSDTSLIKWIDDFSNIDAVISVLNDGFIVVSRKHNEVGVEYLAPFRRDHDNSLIVAVVQCKFLTDTVNWGEIKDKMLTATSGLKNKGIAYFPIIYTTTEQIKGNEDAFSDGIYFVETDIFEWTKKLGILRLHLKKLGIISW